MSYWLRPSRTAHSSCEYLCIRRTSRALRAVVDVSYALAEGPVQCPRDAFLLLSDITRGTSWGDQDSAPMGVRLPRRELLGCMTSRCTNRADVLLCTLNFMLTSMLVH